MTITIPMKDTVTILVAEDDRNDQLLLAMAASESEHAPELRFVDNGLLMMADLWVRLDEGKLPDLLILDLSMPVVNGFQVLEELQKDPQLARIPVVVLSNSRRAADKARAFSDGAHAYEVKPSTYSGLTDLVDWMVGLAKQNRSL